MSVIKNYPIINGEYQHYKGGLYKVITMATDAATGEPAVVYQSLLFQSMHVRLLKEWNEKAYTVPGNENTKQVERYRFIKKLD